MTNMAAILQVIFVKCIFVCETIGMLIQILHEYILSGPTDNKSALVNNMNLRWTQSNDAYMCHPGERFTKHLGHPKLGYPKY